MTWGDVTCGREGDDDNNDALSDCLRLSLFLCFALLELSPQLVPKSFSHGPRVISATTKRVNWVIGLLALEENAWLLLLLLLLVSVALPSSTLRCSPEIPRLLYLEGCNKGIQTRTSKYSMCKKHNIGQQTINAIEHIALDGCGMLAGTSTAM